MSPKNQEDLRFPNLVHYSSAKINYRKHNLRTTTWNRLKTSNQKAAKLCVLLSCMTVHTSICVHTAKFSSMVFDFFLHFSKDRFLKMYFFQGSMSTSLFIYIFLMEFKFIALRLHENPCVCFLFFSFISFREWTMIKVGRFHCKSIVHITAI